MTWDGSSFRHTTFAFVDVETTGFSPHQDRVVEVACVLTRAARRIDSFSSLIDPGCPIPATASAIHHLTDDCVRGAPTLGAVTPWLKAFVGDAVVVAHNASFDLGFLPFLRERPTLCSMRFAQLAVPDAPNFKNRCCATTSLCGIPRCHRPWHIARSAMRSSRASFSISVCAAISLPAASTTCRPRSRQR